AHDTCEVCRGLAAYRWQIVPRIAGSNSGSSGNRVVDAVRNCEIMVIPGPSLRTVPEWRISETDMPKANLATIKANPVSLATRVDAIDWAQATADLDAQGCAVVKGLLSPEECVALVGLYPDDKNFRSKIVMGRHGFGRGEYKYFAYPLPDLIAELRPALYARLHGVANRWHETMWIDIRYPDRHETFLKRCHDAGQTRPTPLLLQYGEGDY